MKSINISTLFTWVFLVSVYLMQQVQGMQNNNDVENKALAKMNLLKELHNILNNGKGSPSAEMKANNKFCDKQIKKCENKFEKCDASYSDLMKSFGEKYKNLQSCLLQEKNINDKLCTCKTENEKCNGKLECCENNFIICEKGLENCGDMSCPNDLVTCEDDLEKCLCQVQICDSNQQHCAEDLENCNTDLTDCKMKIGELHENYKLCEDDKYYCFGNLTDCLKSQDQLSKDICACNNQLEDCEEKKEECEEEKASCNQVLMECEANYTNCHCKIDKIEEFCNAPFTSEVSTQLCAYGGAIYFISDTPGTRDEAEAKCDAVNGKLVPISSTADFQDMTKMLTSCGKSLTDLYNACLNDNKLPDDSYFCNGIQTPTASLTSMLPASNPIDTVNNCIVFDPSTASSNPIFTFQNCESEKSHFFCKISKPCDQFVKIPPPPTCH